MTLWRAGRGQRLVWDAGEIALSFPGGDLALELLAVVDSPVQALAFEHPDLDLDHVEPTGVLGGVVELQPLQDAMRLGGREGRRASRAYGWTGCPAPPGCTRHRGSPRRRVRAAAWRSPAPCAARLPSPCATAGARPRPRTGSPCRCGDTRNQRARAGRARPGWARAPRQSVEEGSRRGTPLGAPGRGVRRTDRARPPCARRTRRRSSARTTSSRARA